MEDEDHRGTGVFDESVCDARGTRGFVIRESGDGVGESQDGERGFHGGGVMSG